MSVSKSFIELVRELLAPVGHITIKRMFSGAGVYDDGVIFAFVVEDALYLKASADTQRRFESEGLRPFTFKAKSGPVATSYWRVPERLFDDSDEMGEWAREALRVARQAAAAKAKKPRARKSSR